LHRPESYGDAVHAYEKSLELASDQFEALANLGDACLQLGRTEEAIKALDRAATIKSDDVNVHFLLAQSYLRSGNRENALREYELLKGLDGSLAEKFGKLLNE
jgi:tetratricopeptide (TPR) repeat protein